ncbi:MAG: glutaredoxin family protein [Caldilineaceae bacterium]
MRVVLYSKPDCHLCETVKADLLSLQSKIGFTVLERNIEEDPDDFLRFRYLIPVLDIEGESLLYPPHTWYSVYQALQAAQDRQNAVDG